MRPPLRGLGVNAGKKARLNRIMFRHGLQNGTTLFLLYDQGLAGLIFGRNVWQREHSESLRFVDQLKEILAKYPSTG